MFVYMHFELKLGLSVEDMVKLLSAAAETAVFNNSSNKICLFYINKMWLEERMIITVLADTYWQLYIKQIMFDEILKTVVPAVAERHLTISSTGRPIYENQEQNWSKEDSTCDRKYL